jgi:hypothetical protein
MAPLGLGAGFYGVGPTIGSDNAAAVVAPTGTTVRVGDGNDNGLYFEASVLKSTFRDSFTIAFWVKLIEGQPSSQLALFGNYGNSTGSGKCNLHLETDGKLNFGFEENSDSHQYKTDAAVFASGSSAYKHIAITMTKAGDTENSVSVIYVDGTRVDTSVVSGNEITGGNHSTWDDEDDAFGIGAASLLLVPGHPSSFIGLGTQGEYAEFAIWNVALSAGMVAAIEALGVPTASNFPDLTASSGAYNVEDDLVTYHKLNDYSGAIALELITGTPESQGRLLGVSNFMP